ncbi:MAG: hypothetical protein ACR2RB_05960 [Gammaproteobacteria bacterium]
MKHRRTVFIPIVEPAGGANDRLLEVYAQPCTAEDRKSDSRAFDQDWDPIAVNLRAASPTLYRNGCVAAATTRKLGLKPRWAAFYQRLRPQSWIESQRLHPVTVPGPNGGKSAELGLCLALFMAASGSARRKIIATGQFSDQPEQGNDARILCVENIPRKLALIKENLPRSSAARSGSRNGNEPWLCFTPETCQHDGRIVNIGELPLVDELRERGVKVVPVESLRKAVQIVGAHQARYLPFDRVSQAFAAALATLTVLLAVWMWWLHAAIPIAFVPASVDAGLKQPFQACITNDGQYYFPVSPDRDGMTTVYPLDSYLGWRLRVGNKASTENRLLQWLGYDGYYVAYVMLSELSDVRIDVPPRTEHGDAFRVAPGEVWEWAWKLNDQAETNNLVLLARRHAPFNVDKLRKLLLKQFDSARGDELDITAAANYVATLAPGVVMYTFQTRRVPSACNSRKTT